ncbi:MAG: glycerophosphodiester phosphodiesterase [Anaerolineae bacterium]|nr:glycerophosphodiester phosphodiesterase [Anaerolineae bacterium]
MPSALPMPDFYQGRILNFAHRGASHDAPENTLAAFRLAAQYGADGIELDVTFSADREVVVIHNDTVDATTDGSGEVASMPLAALKELDAGAFFSPEYAGERIPTLAEVFEALGDRVLINVELKGLRREADGLEAAVAGLIARHGLASRVIISAFNPLRLRRMRKVAPDLPLGFLHENQSPLWLRWTAAALLTGVHPEADHPHDPMVTPEYLARRRRRDQRVNVWVVNDPARMRELRDMGADLIMTDRPDVLRAVLQGEL